MKLTAEELALEELMKAGMAASPDVENGEPVYTHSAEDVATEAAKIKARGNPYADPDPITEEEESSTAASDPGNGSAVKQPGRRGKKDAPEYRNKYLRKRMSAPRKQTYISTEFYEKITSFLSVAAKGISITTFLDNIIEEHLTLYKEEMNNLYNKNVKDPI